MPLSNSEAKALAAKLHDANLAVIDAKRTAQSWPWGAAGHADTASKIIKEVIESLMDMPGQTDYYGNPTQR